MRIFFATMALCLLLAAPAEARPRHLRQHHRGNITEPGQPFQCRGIPWCGCWLRLRLGIADRRFDRARTWYGAGVRLTQCQIGAVAVWPNHVGQVTACLGGGFIQMISGNDGNAVRDRVRPSRGAQFRAL